MDLTTCPECAEAAEVQWLAVMDSTDGPVAHAKILCVSRHWFFLPVAALRPEVPSPPQFSSRAPGGTAMSKQQTVRQVMKRPTTTIEAGAHLAAAAYLMKHAHDSALVVVTDNTHEPVALITEADIANAVAEGRNVEETRISELVATRPVTVRTDALLDDAMRLMLAEGVRHLPVVEGRRLVGMVELADLASASLTPGPLAVAEK